jgi:fibronectin-binding autotransporter adhesin
MKFPYILRECAVALVLPATLISTAHCADHFFNVTSNGDFAVAGNWQNGLPSGFDNTFIGSSALGTPARATATANLSTDVTALSTGSLFLGQGSSGNGTLNILSGGSLQYGLVHIGRDAGAVGVLSQSGGMMRVNTSTFEILSGGASGTYNLSGGELKTVHTGAMAIKVGASGSGTGYFNMSGGTFNAGTAPHQHSLNVGWSSKGEATFSGGIANLSGDLNAGNNANGLITISDTAQVNVSNVVNVGLNAAAANSQLTVSGGTLAVTSGIKVNNSSKLEVSGGTISATGLEITSSGSVTVSGGTINIASITNNGSLTYGNTSGNLTRSNLIIGTGTVTKTGGGTATLTGNNSYTGTTSVNQGTLLINGNQSTATGNLTVASGATLGGTGTVGGATTVSGNLMPGNSPGLLTFANSLTLDSTAVTTMEITGTNSSGTRGVTYDAVDVASALTYGGTLSLNFDTLFTQTGNYTFNLFDSPTISGSFGSVSLAGVYSGSFTDNSGIWGLTQGDNNWSFNQGDGILTFTVVPEPNVAMVAGSLALMALLRRRRD